MLVAAAGLRRARAARAGGGSFLRGSRRTEDRELPLDGAALAFGAGYSFPHGENDGFEVVLTLAAVVFENRHVSYSGLNAAS